MVDFNYAFSPVHPVREIEKYACSWLNKITFLNSTIEDKKYSPF